MRTRVVIRAAIAGTMPNAPPGTRLQTEHGQAILEVEAERPSQALAAVDGWLAELGLLGKNRKPRP